MDKSLTSVLLFLLCSAVAGANDIWVSPRGNDYTGDGTTVKPFRTVNRALEVPFQKDTLFINVAPGTYYLDTPITLNRKLGGPVVVRGHGKTKPVLSGGLVVGGWQSVGNGRYRCRIPEAYCGLDFSQFYVNGKRAVPARTPDSGFLIIEGSKETGVAPDARGRYTLSITGVDLPEGSLEGINRSKGMMARFYHKWDNSEYMVRHIDRDSSRIYISGTGAKPWNPIKKNSRCYLYGSLQFCNAPGEWYYNKAEGQLYYCPRPGEDLTNSLCVVPLLNRWIVITGTPNNRLGNITFRNLSFQYCSDVKPNGGEYEPEQAAMSSPAAAVFDFSDNIAFEDCEMLHTGSYALWFKYRCENCAVKRCYFSDLGAGAVKLGIVRVSKPEEPVTSHIVIDNNIITDGGYDYPCAVGICLINAADNTISHNEISNLRYTGISLGIVRSYSYSPSVRNIVEYNHIHHIGWAELSDMGAIYNLGPSKGTRISNNVIHDVVSFGYGGWGIYTDQSSSDIEIRDNLTYRCKCGGFVQHYGRNNRVENNIFAYAPLYQAQFSKKEDHVSFSFAHNIILQDRGMTLKGVWHEAKIDFGPNLYWAEEGSKLNFSDKSDFATWQKNHEPESIEADPLFVDPHNLDFHFSSTANIDRIGFKPFDYTKAGVYGSDEWKDKAKLSQEVIDAFEKAIQKRKYSEAESF